MGKPIPSLIWLRPTPPRNDRLDRPGIVRAAIAVADSRGPDALTMAAVAGELGNYTAMALYRYVGNKDGLIDLMLDEAVGEIVLPEPSAARWRAQLQALALDTWAMANRHPWYPRLMNTRPPLGPNTLRRAEAALALLDAAGVNTTEALSYVALLDRHVYATAVAAAEEAEMLKRYGLTSDDLVGTITDLQHEVARSGRYPLLSRWMSDPRDTTADQLTQGLDFLFDGIAARITATA